MASMLLWLALAAALLLCAAADSGTAIFYVPVGDETGGCGYPTASLRDWAGGSAAISPNSSIALQASPLGGCGTCLQVTTLCPSEAAAACQPASILVVVSDICGTCTPDRLSLDQATYEQLGGDPTTGSLPIEFTITDCRVASNISISISDYRSSAGGWLHLALTSVAGSGGIASVELRQSPLVLGRLDLVASAWRRMHNIHGAAWELSGLPLPPLDLRITDSANRQVLARKVITEAGKLGLFKTSVQFAPSDSPEGIATANSATLTLPEAAAGLLPAGMAPEGGNSTAKEQDGGSLGLLDDGQPTPAAEEAGEEDAVQPLDVGITDAGGTCNSTILGILNANRAFSVLVSLIRTAGLEGALLDNTTALTLFAPTNSAWLTAVRSWPMLRYDQDTLKSVLMQHLVMGMHTADAFHPLLERFDTLGGGTLSIKSTGSRLLVVSQASVGATLKEDIGAAPGCGGSSVVHAVSSVLMPTMSRRRLL